MTKMQNLGWGSEIRIQRGKKSTGSGSATQKKIVQEENECEGIQNIHPGDPNLDFLPIPDLGFRGQKVPDPGSGSAKLRKKDCPGGE